MKIVSCKVNIYTTACLASQLACELYEGTLIKFFSTLALFLYRVAKFFLTPSCFNQQRWIHTYNILYEGGKYNLKYLHLNLSVLNTQNQ